MIFCSLALSPHRRLRLLPPSALAATYELTGADKVGGGVVVVVLLLLLRLFQILSLSFHRKNLFLVICDL
jgi:hypothetical protein